MFGNVLTKRLDSVSPVSDLIKILSGGKSCLWAIVLCVKVLCSLSLFFLFWRGCCVFKIEGGVWEMKLEYER